LLLDRRIKPHSNEVLCHKPYIGPYFIADIVGDNAEFGPAYRLIHVESGKALRRLISGDRLRLYTADRRANLESRLPGVSRQRKTTPVNKIVKESQTTDKIDQNGYEPAKKILKERTVNKTKQYPVLFTDGSQFWCTDVNAPLLQEYRIRQARQRNKRRIMISILVSVTAILSYLKKNNISG